MNKKQDIPKATSTRLSKYLRLLEYCCEQSRSTISSREIGERLQLTDTQVRKDLTYFGQFGSPGVGYHVEDLIKNIREILGTDRLWPVAIVGMGNLGHALATNKSFDLKGFHVAACFDNSEDVVGQVVADLEVHHFDDFEEIVKEGGIKIGVVAVPAEHAQPVIDQMVKAGIRAFLNFAPIHPEAPEDVYFVTVDLAILFEQLTFRINQNI